MLLKGTIRHPRPWRNLGDIRQLSWFLVERLFVEISGCNVRSFVKVIQEQVGGTEVRYWVMLLSGNPPPV